MTLVSLSCIVQLGYLLVVDKAEVGQWMTEMGLSLVVRVSNRDDVMMI